MGMGDWSNLCEDVLKLIMDEFSEIIDIVRFGAVCRHWRLVSVVKRQLSMVYPWLMLAEKKHSDSRGFYSLSTQKVYHLNLPEARGRRCWSSHGWLITFGIDLKIHLLNPFSRIQIQLPPQPTLPDQYPPYAKSFTPKRLRNVFIRKVVLSSRPSLSVKTTPCEDDNDNEKCVVMAISSQFRKLAFLRLGDEVWTAIECPNGINDVIYFNGQFYAVNTNGKLFICDISSPQPKTIEFGSEPEEGVDEYAVYDHFLVESQGELFLVAGEIIVVEADPDSKHVKDRYETCGFDVYKFNFDDRKWMQVHSLDDCALFVGNNTAFAIFPSKQHPGCEPNCIYFTDSFEDNLFNGAGHDIGVFRLETQDFKPHYVGPNFFSYFCPPLWICPSL